MLVSHEAVAGLWILWNEHGNKVEAPLMFGAVNPLQKGKLSVSKKRIKHL